MNQLEQTGQVEIDGELYCDQLVTELRELDLNSQLEQFNRPCMLSELASGGSDRKSFDSLIETLQTAGAEVDTSFEEPKEFWVIKQRYAGYVPEKLFRHTVSWLEGIEK